MLERVGGLRYLSLPFCQKSLTKTLGLSFNYPARMGFPLPPRFSSLPFVILPPLDRLFQYSPLYFDAQEKRLPRNTKRDRTQLSRRVQGSIKQETNDIKNTTRIEQHGDP